MIGEDQGRIFEIGFNIGILTYLEQQKLASEWVNYYRRDLQQLRFSKICDRLINRSSSISALDRKIIQSWSQLLLFKSFLGGYNFFREYLKSTNWNLKRLEILYYQCSFANDNSIGTYNKDDEIAFRELLSKLEQINPASLDAYLRQYSQKGEFLKADTLLLLRYAKREYRILALDASVFATQSGSDLANLEFIELIKRKLIREINYLRSKGIFSKLRIDTGDAAGLDFSFSPELKNYFTAFKFRDKETAKLIQAGGYAYSFYGFLQQTKIIPAEAKVVLSAVGYSDRSMNTITVRQQNLRLLETCYNIYKHDSSESEIPDARKDVLNQIKRQARRSFDNGKALVESLVNIPRDETTVISHCERIDNFLNSVALIPADIAAKYQLDPNLDLRNAHAELIHRALLSDNLYLFLTGNPGIGKTTAIANFLKHHKDEGFLFFYASPRKQVNLDIIEKFKDETGALCDRTLVCLNTNSQIIAENEGHPTVQYLWEQFPGCFSQNSVSFLDVKKTVKRNNKSNSGIKRKTDELLVEASKNTAGVIKTICQGIYTLIAPFTDDRLINNKTSNKIVASISIQALKKTGIGQDTLQYFGKIFQGAYNSSNHQLIPEKMQAISQHIKHIFIMIDEITEDDGGVEFLNRISKIIRDYELTDGKHGFNTKIIVADASIVDKDVIKQHLSDRTPEPDKIFFRKAKNAGSPFSVEDFQFKQSPATLINANSYPASSLDISYKIVVNSSQFREDDRLKRQNDDLVETLQQEIIADINKIWQDNQQFDGQILVYIQDKQQFDGQILVYIQDKQRLQKLIEQISKTQKTFEKNKDYLEVHANLAEADRKEINRYQEQVKIIFMTSSGSRGLSFPQVKHLLVEIPRFQVEKNLMEVIQVIYRGRGNKKLDSQHKQLIFYLSERAVYYEDNPGISLQESVLNILDLLLILKASIMTRILGSGAIGRENYLIIPIGGKSVSTAGGTLSSELANLIRELKLEMRNKPGDTKLEQVHTRLKELLSQADFRIEKQDITSYIAEDFTSNFFQSIDKKNLSELLNFGDLETGYINGSLLLVPFAGRRLEETYTMLLNQIIDPGTNELWNNLCYINQATKTYHENLRFATGTAIELVNKIREQIGKISDTNRIANASIAITPYPYLHSSFGKQ